ncbi:MAG: hypothetical protein ACI9JN_000248 [Bacteroidia bacterium]|jgi:hypothetical protein
MNLIIEQPSWFIVLCIALGALFSYVMYQKSLRPKDGKSRLLQWVMAFFRFVTVTLLAILVLNPLLQYIEESLEKPVVFVSIDQSSSMVLGGDSAYIQSGLNEDISELREALSNKFEIITLGGESSEGKFDEATTDLSAGFNEVKKLYDNRSVAAMIIVSDGIYNRGANPNFASQKANFPIFTLPVGDTTVHRDVSIYSAKANAVTFLGNQFPLEVIVNATKASGQSVELSVWHNGQKIDKHQIVIQGQRFTIDHSFLLTASQKGNQQYIVRVSFVEGEVNRTNNSKQVYTDVLDVKQKILLAAHAAHPDVAVLRKVIMDNDQYELEVQIGLYEKIEKDKYDLVLTHQLPVNAYESNYLQSLKESKVPVFAFLGAQTNIPLFNKLELGFEISNHRKNFNQGLAQINSSFALFEPKQALVEFINSAPPLITPFGEYAASPSLNTLAFQKIGSVITTLPMWSFMNNSGYRSGVCSGEGIWRWRFYDYERNDNSENVDGLIRKTIQYLALKDDKRKFKVYTSSRNFFENERISFIGEVYNDSYEFTADANVELKLNHSDGTQFSYTLVPQNGSYRYGVGALPAGAYSFSATAQYNGAKFTESGSFVVKVLQLESQNLTANFGIMRQLAAESGGQSFDKNSWDQLTESIMSLPNTASVVKESSRFKDLISQKWLFFLLFGLLTMEWFARRWLGGY